ncbi:MULTISPECIES: hypothetical protein [Vibrio]|uniref:hypothetical protein n=1 Tax=Vibrio TaxID=662 RepID=UPI0004DF43E1|nr:hypothetical protein [Vibrio parahaemolyticus]EGQ9239471.1 hypothetical protein [Vibrio vulnificus]EHD1698113.1 hypothetical protein [Vibrio vulnificus]EKZ9225842.1 hypothetical protein [Vibrio vulnificus]ELC9582684.1 hypothetical protein [Vibrio vulnificus]MCU8149779.1 hypothetical protein [Vibrio vulnificus]
MYSAIQEFGSFTQLIQKDVLYQLTTAYPEEGSILATDILDLEKANALASPDEKAQSIKRVFENIRIRSIDIKAKAIKTSTSQSSTGNQNFGDAPQLTVLY